MILPILKTESFDGLWNKKTGFDEILTLNQIKKWILNSVLISVRTFDKLLQLFVSNKTQDEDLFVFRGQRVGR